MIRKGDGSVDETCEIPLLLIGGNHVVYISNVTAFLKTFHKVKKEHEMCKYCLVTFLDFDLYEHHMKTTEFLKPGQTPVLASDL